MVTKYMMIILIIQNGRFFNILSNILLSSELSMDPVALAHNVHSLLEKKKTQTAPIRNITYDKQVVRKSAFSMFDTFWLII